MADGVECGNCGEPLSNAYGGPSPRKPCPKCGSTRRVFSESMNVRLNLSGTATESLKYGHTGREVMGSKAEGYAIEWAGLGNRDAMLNHPGAEDFRRSVGSAPCLSGDTIVLFRGQGILDTEPKPPSVSRMGPLPLENIPGEGRYHRAGERVLYLTSSGDGSRREMEAWCTAGTPYLIRVELPLTKFRIADFMDWPSDHFVTAVFSKAEQCKVDGRGPKSYVFSQVVAELVSAQFDGMRIPGVRGEPGAHYNNVVIFSGLSEWPQWIAPGGGAYPLRAGLPHEYIAVAAYYLWEKDGKKHGCDLLHWHKAVDELTTTTVIAR